MIIIIIIIILLSQLKEMERKKKRGKEKRETGLKKKRREIITGRFSASEEGERKLTFKLVSSKCHTAQHGMKK